MYYEAFINYLTRVMRVEIGYTYSWSGCSALMSASLAAGYRHVTLPGCRFQEVYYGFSRISDASDVSYRA